MNKGAPKRKSRTLLKSFYGFDKPESVPTTDPLNIGKVILVSEATPCANAACVDSVNFDAEQYFKKILSEKPLNGLVQRGNELATETRQLDGELKTLVYENYGKFISATESIQNMRRNVDNMENEMARLSSRMDVIFTESSKVHEAMEPKRTKIQQLNNVHHSLKRLQFIFDLPTRLRSCLEKGQLSTAVQYYVRTRPLFAHYKSLQLFDGIEKDAMEIMKGVREELWNRFHDSKQSLKSVNETVGLLVTLDEDLSELWQQYLPIMSAKLEDHLQAMADVISAHVDASSVNRAEEYDRAITDLWTELDTSLGLFQLYFLQDSKAKATARHRSSSVSSRNREANIMKLIAGKQQLLGAEERLDAAKRSQEVSMRSFNRSLSIIKDSLDPTTSEVSKLESDMDTLALLLKKAPLFNNLCKSLDAWSRVESFVSEYEANIVYALMTTVTTGITERINAFGLQISEDARRERSDSYEGMEATFILDCEEWLLSFVASEVFPVIQRDASILEKKLESSKSRKKFLAQVDKTLKTGMRRITETAMKPAGDLTFENSVTYLMCSRFVFDLGEYNIAQIYTAYSNILYPDPEAANRLFQDATEVRVAPHLLPDLDESSEAAREAGQAMLNEYVMMIGGQLSNMLRASYDTQPQIEHLNEPSQICAELVRLIQACHRDAQTIFPSEDDAPVHDTVSEASEDVNASHEFYQQSRGDPRSQPNPSVTSLSSVVTTKQTAPQNLLCPQVLQTIASGRQSFIDIDRLFSEKVEVFGKVDPSGYGICTAIIRIVFKAWIEIIRLQTLGKQEFWRLQIDVEWVRARLWVWFRDDLYQTRLLEEVIMSAFNRCTHPTAVDAKTLEQAVGIHWIRNL
ncbi:hypothetical protein BZG36_00931 [Bifiguratus adelaidae]|uniref:Vacuolar protein sorting-associated protein 51 homolog n=1 Tax=Bifiguratus adelaidae TaxID=1938954 RepID=A0A261Y5I5_9FUNG|nr:hypothetical protein BZG36_00931 [Bifiguratus adelaidae]